MCTVSVVRRRDGFRVACNRDERRSRPAASPPQSRRAGRQHAIWPVDPVGGGTWIGVNEAAMVLVLLNRNVCGANAPEVEHRPSRGTLIPRLLGRRRLDEVLDDAIRIEPDAFAPFTLVALQERQVGVVTRIGAHVTLRREGLSAPILFTSSSLGDALVDGPRRALFADLVSASAEPLAGQRAYHRHQWPDRPEISVQMSRPDAATVSRTIVDVDGGSFFLRYTPLTRS